GSASNNASNATRRKTRRWTDIRPPKSNVCANYVGPAMSIRNLPGANHIPTSWCAAENKSGNRPLHNLRAGDNADGSPASDCCMPGRAMGQADVYCIHMARPKTDSAVLTLRVPAKVHRYLTREARRRRRTRSDIARSILQERVEGSSESDFLAEARRQSLLV